MDTAELLRRMEREAEFWVDLAPGKRIKLARPLMDQARPMAQAGVNIATVCEYLRGWEGITEADLLKGGSADVEIEFDSRIATRMLRDHIGWSRKAANRLAEELLARGKATEDVEKNSEDS